MRIETELHMHAVEQADQADAAERAGRSDQAKAHVLNAYKYEREAALIIAQDSRAEPSRSVLLRSAAVLAIKCKKYEDAVKLIDLALSGMPSEGMVTELLTLREELPPTMTTDTNHMRLFLEQVTNMIEMYRHYIEENDGWQLLWNDDGRSKNEKAAQLLFFGTVKHYCEANNIDVSPEPNAGRGPVDFKFSRGYQLRALLEVKLARNTKFWSGLKKQLPKYMKVEKIQRGYFLVVCYTDADLRKIDGIDATVAVVNKSADYDVSKIVVDARCKKKSASLL